MKRFIRVYGSGSGSVRHSGCRTVSNNGSGSGLVPAQNILAVQVRFKFPQVKFYWFWFGFTKMKRFIRVYGSGSGSVRHPS